LYSVNYEALNVYSLQCASVLICVQVKLECIIVHLL